MFSQLCLLSLGLVLSLLSQGDAACSMTSPCKEELGQGQPFAEPVQLSSRSARWKIKLNVDVNEVNYGWLKLKRRVYNGKIVGPTWTIKRGDRLILKLKNSLSIEGNQNIVPHNTMGAPNTTNMHTHGLHISSDALQDDVLKKIEPGEMFRYVYQIHEQNPHGTYWYHPHVHQSTMFQVIGGMSGIIIVEDELALMPRELADVSCPSHCDKDLQMIFQSVLQYSSPLHGYAEIQEKINDSALFRHDHIMTDKNVSLTTWLKQNLNNLTVNGLLEPVLTMVTGQIYRYRMVNAAGSATVEPFVSVQGSNTPTSSCDIREISVDGVYLNAPRKLHLGQSFMAPATRIDWLIKCNTPGTYELRSFRRNISELSIGTIDRFDGVLLTITVTGAAVNPVQTFPTTLPPRPDFVGDLRNVTESNIKGRFVLEFNSAFHLNRESWNSATDYRYKMKVNEIQEWHVVNTDSEDGHPLHIHVNHFQIISYNNYTGAFSCGFSPDFVFYNQDDKKPCHYQRSGITHPTGEATETCAEGLKYLGHDQRAKAGNTTGYSMLGDWRDTLLIPPLANITIRFKPERYTGNVIIHCHILSHEDGGMMLNTLIVGKDESVKCTHIKSGNAYPGTCRRCDRYPFNNPKTLCEKRGRKYLHFSGSLSWFRNNRPN